MLIIKGITYFFYSLCIFSLFSTSFNSLADTDLSSQEKLITQVEYFFKQNPDALNYHNIIELSHKIINQRINYPNEIVAKTYLLLAHVANNKGELDTALQFTYDGLGVATKNQTINLHLQLSLAKVFSAKKQYKHLLATIQQAIDIPQNDKNTTCYLIALSYRSVAYSMLGKHSQALVDLQQIEHVIQQNTTFSEHISLLKILADAYYHLGDYQTALTVHQKILKLQFNLNRLSNIDQTYLHLANSYYHLNKLNDAYTAYWEAKKYAIKKDASIYIGYASQGLSLTLLKQKQYSVAKTEALYSKKLFYQNNLAAPYLESIIVLIQIYHAEEQKSLMLDLLLTAERLVDNATLTSDYIVIYQHFADMYLDKKELDKAYLWQNKYSEALFKQTLLTKNIIEFNRSPIKNDIIEHDNKHISASAKARELAIKLAKQSELSSSFSDKFYYQQLFIILSIAIILLLSIFIAFLWGKQRRKQLQTKYDALENPSHLLTNSVLTKQLYQTNFNMARQYDYPLMVGYIAITNWQEIALKFNRSVVDEVTREVAAVINEQLNEFESAGVVNDGEYLLLFPHQDKECVTKTIEKIASALKSRFFANLGEFSVIIAYSIERPDFQDIDPYIFLSQLSGSIELA